MSQSPFRILRLDATGRGTDSVSKPLAKRLIDGIAERLHAVEVTARDLATDPIPPVDAAWIEANFAGDQRTPEQAAKLALSDQLVDEFRAANTIVVTAPIYNFSIPAALKLWIDQTARVGRTFRYTEAGPIPLVPDRPAYAIVASGGTTIGSEIDFATGYLRHVFGFLGISDLTLIEVDRLIFDGEARVKAAEEAVDAMVGAFGGPKGQHGPTSARITI